MAIHVVWDWNGTLFDDLHIVVEGVNASLRELGLAPIGPDEYRASYRRPVHLFYEELLGRPVAQEEMRAIDDTFHGTYHAALDRAALAPDALEAIRAVVRAGHSQSVLSMWWHDRLVAAVKAFGLDEHMIAVDGHRGAPGETKAEHLRHHVAQLRNLYPSLNGTRIVVVGDISDDAAAAAEVGTDCVLYDSGSQPRELLDSMEVPVVDSLLEAVWAAGIRG